MSTPIVLRPRPLAALLLACFAFPAFAWQDDVPLTLKTTVRRVVVDVVVTDAHGNAVPGLAKEDFALSEDGHTQTILSFEANGFDRGMDYLPAKLPLVPPNTFVNLPATAEKGPLYVLLYDLVNMDNQDQMDKTPNQHGDQMLGRQQLVKFIESKPEGARFAIFVWSDGLHLLQGFTSDKAQLFAAIDPASARPHVPKVFLMGGSFGRADPGAALGVMNQIGTYLDGLPGRKNLIWFSGTFPLTLYPGKDDPPSYIDASRKTLDILARNQIAIYPVDVRGVVSSDAHGVSGIPDDREPVQGATGGPVTTNPGSQAMAGKAAHQGSGESLLRGSYFGMDEIARVTGGHAFYSNNDIAGALAAATENGGSFYTLSYAPPPGTDSARLRSIKVELAKKGYQLAYRRSYYGGNLGRPSLPALVPASAKATPGTGRSQDDTLDAYMKHGAPIAHQLVFAAHVHPLGAATKGTPEQMAQIAPYLNAGKKNAKTPAPIPLQPFAIDYTVAAHQLHLGESHAAMNLELAAAAYDGDGAMLNSAVNLGNSESGTATAGNAATPAKPFRVRQVLDVPLAAASLRIAVQDANTGRIGVMEIKLPLRPENTTDDAKAP